jgi:hypothetical protein
MRNGLSKLLLFFVPYLDVCDAGVYCSARGTSAGRQAESGNSHQTGKETQ